MAETKAPDGGGPAKRNEPREVVDGQSAIKDERPGATKTPMLEFEGLGTLEDFPETIDARHEEGVGTKVVVLSDILSGADGETYQKGQVHSISKLVPNYEKADDSVKANIRRLVSLGAIRHATPEEIDAGFATVTVESESEATQTERARRLEAEADNDKLRAELAKLTGKAGADPAPTGTKASDPFNEG